MQRRRHASGGGGVDGGGGDGGGGGGGGVVGGAARRFRERFPHSRDRWVMVVFVLLSTAFLVYQLVVTSTKYQRRLSEPTIQQYSVEDPRMTPSFVMCTSITSNDSAFISILNGDSPPPEDGDVTAAEAAAADPERYQYPFLQVSFDEDFNRLLNRDQPKWNGSSFFEALFVSQENSLGLNGSDLLRRWGYNTADEPSDRHSFPRDGDGNAIATKCLALNPRKTFHYQAPFQEVLVFTAMTFEPKTATQARTLLSLKRFYQVGALEELDYATSVYSPITLDRSGIYDVSFVKARYEFVNGSVSTQYSMQAVYSGPYTFNEADILGLLGVNQTKYSATFAQLAVRPNSYRQIVVREVPSYSISEFLSDMGGSIGIMTAAFALLFPTVLVSQYQLRLGSHLCPCGEDHHAAGAGQGRSDGGWETLAAEPLVERQAGSVS